MNKLTQLRQSHPTCERERRFLPLTVTVNAADLRLETFQGEEFSVVDIVALTPDIVLRPMGSTVPEFVPGDIHPGALHTFADRPVMLNHPVDNDGEAMTALTPKTLEKWRFGHVFHPRYDNELGLILPSWLSDSMASDVGAEAQSVLSDFRDGKSREISVGVWAYVEVFEGTSPSGVDYGAIWLDYDGDHLAILETGDTGACSNDAGCGPVLSGSTKGATVNLLKLAELKAGAVLRRRVLPSIHDAIIDGEFSDREIGDKLSVALMRDEDTDRSFFGWITDLYIRQGIVIYKTFEDSTDTTGGGMDLFIWQRNYKMDKSGSVTLRDNKQKVAGFTPVLETAGKDATIDNNSEGDKTMSVSAEITRLVGVVIALKSSPFDENAQAYLEGQDEKWLKEVEERFADADCGCGDGTTAAGTTAEGTTTGVATQTAASTDDATVTVVSKADLATLNETIVALGAELTAIRPAANQWVTQLATDKAALVAAIKAAKPELSDAVYKDLEVAALRDLHGALGLAKPARVTHNYEGAIGGSDGSSAHERTEIPDPYAAALKQRAASRAV